MSTARLTINLHALASNWRALDAKTDVETGAVVKVPLFVNIGDVLRVDTRTSEYQNSVKR